MTSIQILRLSTGEDIVGFVVEQNGDYEVTHPMGLELQNKNGQETNILLFHWLPIQVVDENFVVLRSKDILFTITPNVQFEEYYLNTVEKIQKLFDAKYALEDMEKNGTPLDAENNPLRDFILERFQDMEIGDGYKKH